jgi:hypothetical protein
MGAKRSVERLWGRGFATLSRGGVINPLERRVVVTGLGLVTPLGVGVQHVWARLTDGACGVRKLVPEDLGVDGESLLKQLTSTVRKIACLSVKNSIKGSSSFFTLNNPIPRYTSEPPPFAVHLRHDISRIDPSR